MSWLPVNLGLLGEREPVLPSIAGLVYPGRRHLWSGPPESGKTLVAYWVALEYIRDGGTVALIDFEMGPYDARDRLRDLGATGADFARLVHVDPGGVPASAETLERLVDEFSPGLVILDAAAGAFAVYGLDDNQRADVEAFAGALINPFWHRGIATILLDHVPKNADARGRFAIGSERKVGGADVHLGFEAIAPLGRGRSGLIKITTHKDRFGHLPRPQVGEIAFCSDPETHAITGARRDVAAGEGAPISTWRPDVLMQRVSDFLQEQSEPVTRNAIERDVRGTAKYVRQAIDALIASGHVHSEPGSRGSQLLTSISPFTPSASDRVGTASATQSAGVRRTVSPSQGDTVDDEVGVDDIDQRLDRLSAALRAAQDAECTKAILATADGDALHALLSDVEPVPGE